MRPYGDWQTGLLNADGTPKPAFHEYGAPAFAGCTRGHNRRWIAIWSRMRGSRNAARAEVELRAPGAARAGGAWLPMATYPAPRLDRGRAAQVPAGKEGAALTRFVPWRPGITLRVRWSDGEGRRHTSPVLTAGRCPAPTRKPSPGPSRASS